MTARHAILVHCDHEGCDQVVTTLGAQSPTTGRADAGLKGWTKHLKENGQDYEDTCPQPHLAAAAPAVERATPDPDTRCPSPVPHSAHEFTQTGTLFQCRGDRADPTPALAALLADVLMKHEEDFTYDGKKVGCSCGWWAPRSDDMARDTAQHVARALIAAGVTLNETVT